MASDTYHEPLELLSEDTKNTHRAIVSLMEELEAIDRYQQRAEGRALFDRILYLPRAGEQGGDLVAPRALSAFIATR